MYYITQDQVYICLCPACNFLVLILRHKKNNTLQSELNSDLNKDCQSTEVFTNITRCSRCKTVFKIIENQIYDSTGFSEKGYTVEQFINFECDEV